MVSDAVYSDFVTLFSDQAVVFVCEAAVAGYRCSVARGIIHKSWLPVGRRLGDECARVHLCAYKGVQLHVRTCRYPQPPLQIS